MELNKNQMNFLKKKYDDNLQNIMLDVISLIERPNDFDIDIQITEIIENILEFEDELWELIKCYYDIFDLKTMIDYSKKKLHSNVRRVLFEK